ncbi:MAG: ABC transporter permease [Lachnospiraceae bacterium]|nr:ABC transporter permease [Lachnospiraceae bacterium]
MKKYATKFIGALALPVVVYLVFLICIPTRFGNWNCIYTIFLQSIVPTITAYAVALGNIPGMFDFSVGSEQIISGVVGGLMAARFGIPGMIIGALAAALIVTLITGLLNNVLRIPSLVLTMGIAMVYEIVGSKMAGHYGFVQIDTEYAIFGKAPNIVIVFLIAVALFYFLFNHTVFGYNLRAVGSNERVALNSGVKVKMTKLKAFLYGGIFIAISAILTLSQSGSVGTQQSLGSVQVIFKPLIAVLLALVFQKFCNLTFGIFIAQFTINTIFIGLIAAGLPDTFQNVVLGIFLLIVMLVFRNTEAVEAMKERMKIRKEMKVSKA